MHHKCLTDPDSGLPNAMSMEDPGEGNSPIGKTKRCSVCNQKWQLVGRSGFVFWEPDDRHRGFGTGER